jgi:hypothetical protein
MPRSAIAGLRGAQIAVRFVAVVFAAVLLISFSGSLAGWLPAAVSLNRFDPMLGTLTAAILTLGSTTSLVGSVDAVAKFGSASAGASFTGFFEMIANDIGLGSIFTSSLSAGAACSGQGCHSDGSNALPFLGSYGAPTLDGFGGSDDFTLILSAGIVPSLYDCNGACTIGGSFGWNGNLTIEYTYVSSGAASRAAGGSPSAVPEPAPLGMLAMAGMLMIMLRRRRS